MNVRELKEKLDDYGDHLPVLIEKPSGSYANIESVGDADVQGEITVLIYSPDL